MANHEGDHSAEYPGFPGAQAILNGRSCYSPVDGPDTGYLALLGKKQKLASCPARVIAFAWQPMHVPP